MISEKNSIRGPIDWLKVIGQTNGSRPKYICKEGSNIYFVNIETSHKVLFESSPSEKLSGHSFLTHTLKQSIFGLLISKPNVKRLLASYAPPSNYWGRN